MIQGEMDKLVSKPGDDVTVYNSYTAANQLASMGPSGGPYTTFSYDSLNRLSQKILPNLTKTIHAYDSLSELLSLTHKTSGGQVLLSTGYTYDVLGNRLTRTDNPSVEPSPSTTDPSAWSYDVTNRLLTRPGVTYTYDNNGNTLTKTDASGTTTYGYDFENRLISASIPGGIVATYAYDPFGRRISKTVDGVVTQYLYDGMNLIKEYDGSGALLATYVHGPGIDEPISMTRGGQTYYYHADGLGSVTGLTDSTQTLVQNYNYDGFGNLNQAPTIQNPYTYTGREWDPETGLYYYRARYYDPKVGRFLQQDPAGFIGGINLYAYVGNNPINATDPEGLRPLTACEKNALSPYIPPVDLNNAEVNDLPWYIYLFPEYYGITFGNNIYFRKGWYDPNTSTGLSRLGHELVHVGQFRSGMGLLSYLWSTRNGYENSTYEKKAYDMQDQILSDLINRGFKGCECSQ
jgi:RHS repeat-associated protein